MLTVLRPENYAGLSVCSSALSTAVSKCAYLLSSSPCIIIPFTSKAPIPTTCILPISTTEDSSTHIPIKCSPPTKAWDAFTSSAGVNSISEEKISDVQPVSTSKCVYLHIISMDRSSHHTSEIHSLLQHAGIYLSVSTTEENSVHLFVKASKPNKYQSPSAPSASGSTNVVVPALVALVAVFLVLLILSIAGISMVFFLRQRSKSDSESVTSKCMLAILPYLL